MSICREVITDRKQMRKLIDWRPEMKTLKPLVKATSLLTAGALSIGLTAIASAEVMKNDDDRVDFQLRSFEQMDHDQNGRLDWNELNNQYESDFRNSNMRQQDIFNKYDSNTDEGLDENEYRRMSTDIDKTRSEKTPTLRKDKM